MAKRTGLPELKPLFEALESCYRQSAFPWSLAQARPRERWEAAMALLLGRAPVLGRFRPSDVAYMSKGQSALELCHRLDALQLLPPEKGGGTLRLLDSGAAAAGPRASAALAGPPGAAASSDPRPIRLGLFLQVAGMLAFQQGLGLSEDEQGKFYDTLLVDLAHTFGQLAPELAVTFCRLFGIPFFRFRQGEARDAANPITRAMTLLEAPGSPSPCQDWWSLHLRARRIHSGYLARFDQGSMQRGCSAMLQDFMACLREGLLARSSVACLVQDVGGHLAVLLPSEAVGGGDCAGVSRWLKKQVVDTLDEALQSSGGFFAQAYPQEWSAAREQSLAAHGMDLAGWRRRGLFPDLELSVEPADLARECWLARSAFLGEQEDGSGLRPPEVIELRGDDILMAAPPAACERLCYGCHLEPGSLQSPWFASRSRDHSRRKSVCPGCALLLAAGQRLRHQVLEGLGELHAVFRECLDAESVKFGESRWAVTLYLDGMKVGRKFRAVPLLGRTGFSQELERELRARFSGATKAMGVRCRARWPASCWSPQGPRGRSKMTPLEVLWIGGDDVCVRLHPSLLQPFLRGFCSVPGRVGYAGGALLHSTDIEDVVRVSEALRALVSKAKEEARVLPENSGEPLGVLATARLRRLASMETRVVRAPVERLRTWQGLEGAVKGARRLSAAAVP